MRQRVIVNGLEFYKMSEKSPRITSDAFVKSNIEIEIYEQALKDAGFYKIQTPRYEGDVMRKFDWIGHYIFFNTTTYFFEKKEDFVKAVLMIA